MVNVLLCVPCLIQHNSVIIAPLKKICLLKLEKIVTIFLYLICYTADGSRVLAIEKLSLERN